MWQKIKKVFKWLWLGVVVYLLAMFVVNVKRDEPHKALFNAIGAMMVVRILEDNYD